MARKILFDILKRLGCGVMTLKVIIAMYRVTQSVLVMALVTATTGICQGSPTSCVLFIIFVNDLIKMIKENWS